MTDPVGSGGRSLADILYDRRGRIRGPARRRRRRRPAHGRLGSPGSGDARTALDKAIADGKLPGISVDSVDRVAVADDAGVAFVDPTHGKLVKTIALTGGAHGLAVVTGIEDTKLYATAGARRARHLTHRESRWRLRPRTD